MDPRRFDAFVQALVSVSPGTRRGLLTRLSAVPALGGLVSLLGQSEAMEAKKRNKQKKKQRKQRKQRKRKCSRSRVCAGQCGTVDLPKMCKMTRIDCGSCVCDPPCPACQICDEASGRCSDPCNGEGCCAEGTCQPGTSNGACGKDGESCAICSGNDSCQGRSCRCTRTTCAEEGKNCGTIVDGCGGTLDCGACAEGQLCSQGKCHTPCGDVCAEGCRYATIQQAIDDPDGPTAIQLCAGTYQETISIARNLTLQGVGKGGDPASNTILDGNQSGTVVSIGFGRTVSLSGLRITGSNTDGAAGGIGNDGSLTMTNCAVSSNVAASAGGIANSVNNVNATLTMTDCTVSNNIAANPEGTGGGIDNGGILTMTNCAVLDNEAGLDGGGIFNDVRSTATLDATSVTGNYAGLGLGGGILNAGTVNLTNGSTVSGNTPQNCAGSVPINGEGCEG